MFREIIDRIWQWVEHEELKEEGDVKGDIQEFSSG